MAMQVFSASSDASEKKYKDFSIGLSNLPKDVKFRENQIQYFFYIFRQAYAPMFFYNKEKKQLSSLYYDLDKTGAAGSKAEYRFFLKEGLKFNNGDQVTLKDVYNSFDYLAKKQLFLDIKEVKSHQDYISVSLTRENPNFLKQLNFFLTAIIKHETVDHKIPVGLGPYTIKNIKDEVVELHARKDFLEGNVEKIEFNLVNTPEQGKVSKVDDFNFLQLHVRPSFSEEDYNYLMGSSDKVGFLYLKIKNKEVREQIIASINRVDLTEATDYEKAIVLPGLLKKNVPGWNQKMTPAQKRKIEGSYQYDFISYGRFDEKKLQIYFDKSMPSNIKINVKTVDDSTKFLKSWQSNNEQIGFLASGVWEHDVYSFYRESFEELSDDDLFYSLENRKLLESKFKDAISIHIKEKREELFKDIHKTILDQYFYYPMGYFERKFWYPKKIKNFEIFKQHNGMPMLNQLIVE